jgi:hypothetical protein
MLDEATSNMINEFGLAKTHTFRSNMFTIALINMHSEISHYLDTFFFSNSTNMVFHD